jgi:hypothetical protein
MTALAVTLIALCAATSLMTLARVGQPREPMGLAPALIGLAINTALIIWISVVML